MKQRQTGFTLVELIVVIVILGILAATALPRFINVTTNANIAAMNGLAGGLRSATALAQSTYVAAGMTGAGSVTMGSAGATQAVTVVAGGFPTADAAGIGAAMQSLTGFTPTYAAGVATFAPANGPAGCTLTYTAATGVVATGNVTTANCGG